MAIVRTAYGRNITNLIGETQRLELTARVSEGLTIRNIELPKFKEELEKLLNKYRL